MPWDPFTDGGAELLDAAPGFDPFRDGGAQPVAPTDFDPFRDAQAEEITTRPGVIPGLINTARRAGKQLGQTSDVAMIVAAEPLTDPELGFKRRRLLVEVDTPRSPRETTAQYNARVDARTREAIAAEAGTPQAQHSAAVVAGQQRGAAATIQENLGDFSRRQREIGQIPQTARMEAYDQAQGWDAVARLLHPETAANVAVRGAVSSVPAIVAGTAGGLAAGPTGSMAGVGAGSFAQEYLGAITDTLAQRGVDLSDPAALQQAVLDPSFLTAARERGVARGIPVAAFDALSAGIAGRFLKAARMGGTSKAGAALKEAGVQLPLAGGGEATAAVAAGDDLDPKAIAEEMVGDVAPSTREVLQNYLQDRRAAPAKPSGGAAAEDTSGRRVPPVEGPPAAPPVSPARGNLDELLSALEADQADQRQKQADESAQREARQRAAGERRAALDRTLAIARETAANPAATFAQVQGAVQVLEEHAADNSLGLSQEQREAVAGELATLRPRLQELAAAEETRREATRTAGRTRLAAEARAREEQITAERARVRAEARAGIGSSGEFEYNRAPLPALEERAAAGDEQAQQEIVRREETAELERGQPAADEDLLTVLRRQPLPTEDSSGFDGELRELLTEGMSFGQRQQYTRAGTGSLDALAQALRADYGFHQLQRPDELLEAVKAALRGETVMPRGRAVDFAEGDLSPGERAIATRADAHFAPEHDEANAQAYAQLPGTEGGRILNVDTARELSADYRQSRTVARAIHEAASAFMRRRFRRALQAPARGAVAFLAGGPASGKGSVTAAQTSGAELVFDATLKDFARATADIDATLASGRPVRLVYVHRPVEAAVDGAVNRALDPKDGRPVPLGYLGRTHLQAQQTFRRLAAHYAANPRVEMHVIDNSGRVEQARPVGVDYLQQPGVIYDREETVRDRARRAYLRRRGELAAGIRSAFEADDPGAAGDFPAGARPERPDGRPDAREPQAAQALRPALPRELTPRRRDRIWRALQRAVPALTEQVDIEIALNERDMGQRLAANGADVASERLPRIDAALVPAEIRAGRDQARALKDAIIFASHAWQSWRTGAARTVHEVAHLFWYSLPRDTRAALRDLHRHEITSKTGPLFRNGEQTTQLAHVYTLTELGTREWFAERMAALHGGHLHGELRRASGALGRAEMLLRDAWEQFVDLLRQVFAADVRNRLHEDPDSDFWQGAFREFLRGGAMPTDRTRTAATAYAQRSRDVEFAERGPAAQEDATVLEGQRAAAQTAADAVREKFEQADEELKKVEAELTALRDSDEIDSDREASGRALEARRKGAQALRAAHYAAFVAARDRVQMWEDRLRMHKTNAAALAAEVLKGPPDAPASDAGVARYRQLDAEHTALERERRTAEARLEREDLRRDERLELIREQRLRSDRLMAMARELRELGETLDREQPAWRDTSRAARPPEAPASERQPGEDEPSPFEPDTPEYKLDETKQLALRFSGLNRTPPWYKRLQEYMRDLAIGIRGALPEVPAFPRASWNRGDAFLKRDPEFYGELQEGLRQLQRATPGVLQEAAAAVDRITRPLVALRKERFPAAAYDRARELQETLRRRQAEGRAIPPQLITELREIDARMARDPYVLFGELVMYLDFNWRKTHLRDAKGDPITLPMNLNLGDVQTHLVKLRAAVAASPHAAAITEALRQHVDLVRQTAEQLKARDLMAQSVVSNPFYFPHLVVTKTSGRIEQIKLQTAADFRGYLINPHGSPNPIETDYVAAMYYHLAQVGAHNRRADIVREFWQQPYDIMAKVVARAKELTRQRGQRVNWRQAFHEEFADEGYEMFTADQQGTMIPALQIDRDKLAQRLGEMIGDGDIQEELARLGVKGIRILPQDIKEALSSGEKEVWIVPGKVAEALRGIARREHRRQAGPGLWDYSIGKALKGWKLYKLFAPQSWVRYDFNNWSSDVEKVLSADPAMLRQFKRAVDELRALRKTGNPMSEELRLAIKHGVLESITADEIGAIPELPQFDWRAPATEKIRRQIIGRFSSLLTAPAQPLHRLASRTPGFRTLGAMLEIGARGGTTVQMSAMREGIFRYAKFLADLQRLRHGARPIYAGAYWRNIDAITGADADVRKAAEISKKTFGDYGDISVAGQEARQKIAPFFSFLETNFRYHANLFRNLRDALVARDSALASARAGAQASALFTAALTRKLAVGFVLRLATPYLAVALWNGGLGAAFVRAIGGTWDDDDELEEALTEENRRRFHILLGWADEKKTRPQVIYFATALADIMRWFSGPRFVQATTTWMRGESDLPTAMSEWTEHIVPDLLNNVAGSVGPVAKVPLAFFQINTFPDVTDFRTIAKYDVRRVVLSQMTDEFTANLIEQVVNKDFVDPKDLGDYVTQMVLQVRRYDSEQWAFYAIKEKAAEFYEKRSGKEPTEGNPKNWGAKEQVMGNFRRAIYRGDAAVAVEAYNRLQDFGVTAESFQGTIRNQDPLSMLGKTGEFGNLRQDFVDGLNDYDRAQLEKAYRFYARVSGFRGDERRLFPRKARTEAEAVRLRERFRPRPDLIEQGVNDAQNRSEEDIDAQIERDLRRSLRRSR